MTDHPSTPRQRFLHDLVETLIHAGMTRKEAEAEVKALVKWCRETL